MDENSSIFFTAPVHTFFGRKLKLQFLPEQFRNIYIHFHCQPCNYFVKPVADERGREDQTRDWYIITLIIGVYCSHDSATQLLISRLAISGLSVQGCRDPNKNLTGWPRTQHTRQPGQGAAASQECRVSQPEQRHMLGTEVTLAHGPCMVLFKIHKWPKTLFQPQS